VILVRSWNVFHGNSVPPARRGHLRAMIELVAEDAPDVVLLQELPVWALGHIEGWSGMRAHAAVARRSRGPAWLTGWVTRLDQGLFRSRLAGQANAILVRRGLASAALGEVQVSDPGRERRVAHAVRVAAVAVVANVHLTNAPSRPDVQLAELARMARFVDELARPGEPRVIGGDLNLRGPALPGYEGAGSGIDHLLVSGAAAGPLLTWPRGRRVQNGVVLSDHAPVERVVG
jgi:endonuclease/exonuclease/phosphatase family metal-dependent hydrolase